MNEMKPHSRPGLFLPFVFLAAAVTVVFAWNVYTLSRQRTVLLRLREEQQTRLDQAVQANDKVRSMMIEFLTLAESDPRAKAIVDKHGIRFTPSEEPVNIPAM